MTTPTLPRAIASTLLRMLLPRAERNEVLGDLAREYHAIVASDGERSARKWLWQQAIGSAPSLLRWSSRRTLRGYEPPANNYAPSAPTMKYLFADLRFAARRLRARPSYSILAIGTLALGIAGIAAVFGVARPIILQSLPFANEKSVVTFWLSGSWTEQEFLSLRGNFPGYQSVAAYRPSDRTLRDGQTPAKLLPGLETSAELFDVLGARPFLGRAFKTGDDTRGAEPIAVLSYGLWKELGGDEQIIGRRLTLDGAPRTVVGVMPRGFWFPDPTVRVWIPRALDPQARNGSYTLVGQVLPTADPRNMTTYVAQLTRILGERFTYPADWDKTKNAVVVPIRDDLIGNMRPALLATFVAMALILLIACTNVAALLLGQLEARATEFAVRAALGANRRRLTQPLVVEAMLVGVLAALVGAAIAGGGFRMFADALPLGTWSESATFDWSLFAVAFAVAMVSVLFVVLIPGVSLRRHDARGDIYSALSRARTGGVQAGRVRLEGVLVIAEVALTMLIASGAALLVHSVSNLYAINPGIDARGVGVIDVVTSNNLPQSQRVQSVEKLVTALRNIPGVQSAAASLRLPLRGNSNSTSMAVEGRAAPEKSTTFFRMATIDYFKTMGIRLVSGRGFDVSDRPDTTEIPIVINETLARQFFPGENPLGRRVTGGFNVPQRIVGVVSDVAEGSLTDPPKAARYYLASQVPWFGTNASLVFKTTRAADAERLLERARTAITETDPEFAVQQTTTMSRVFDVAVGPARQIMTLLTILSSLALALGGVGIYGVVAHFASRRKRDWAIKVALGMTAKRVVLHVVGQGAALVAVGIAIGTVGTLSLMHFLTSFMYGVNGVDLASFVGASAVVVLTGGIAALVPALRAGAVDPAVVLREQ